MEFSGLHGVHRCRTAEEALCFQAWQMVDYCSTSIALYGHDAKSTKNFTLRFDNQSQCESLDRLWFVEEAWFPVKKYVYEVQSPLSLKIASSIQQNLISNLDKISQNCAFRDLESSARPSICAT